MAMWSVSSRAAAFSARCGSCRLVISGDDVVVTRRGVVVELADHEAGQADQDDDRYRGGLETARRQLEIVRAENARHRSYPGAHLYVAQEHERADDEHRRYHQDLKQPLVEDRVVCAKGRKVSGPISARPGPPTADRDATAAWVGRVVLSGNPHRRPTERRYE